MACMSDFKMTIEITLSISRLRLLGEQRSGGAGGSRDILLLPVGKWTPFFDLFFFLTIPSSGSMADSKPTYTSYRATSAPFHLL